jgi:hypothetical protein
MPWIAPLLTLQSHQRASQLPENGTSDRLQKHSPGQVAAELELGVRALVEQQVGRQFEQFEIALLRNFQQAMAYIAHENARALGNQLESRIQILELLSARQSATLARLSEGSQTSNTGLPVPWLPAPEPGVELTPARHAVEYPSLLCPRCSSNHVRRANRSGFLEELLRVLGLAPFRCRGCRHKFYRFQLRHPPASTPDKLE